MKYVVLIGDGMADRPIKELGGRTPLQVAFTPSMDKMASRGMSGMVSTIPKGLSPGSDVANMSILGYDPTEHYTGRAPLEAASIGVDLEPNDVAYRCNFVTLRFDKDKGGAIMEDHSAGHISDSEAHALIEAIERANKDSDFKYYPGTSYRHLLVWNNGETDTLCTPPHDILGKDISEYLPQGPGSEKLNKMMKSSMSLLQRHVVNKRRVAEGKNPANSIWFWGQGKRPEFESFQSKYDLTGAMTSAVDLTKGLARVIGLEVLKVPGVTGYLDTNYEGKADYSVRALKEKDFVYIHVEAPDEAGHMGNIKDKIKAIEDFDEHVVGRVLNGLMNTFDEYKVLLMPDHATPVELRTHTSEPVPFVIYDSTNLNYNRGARYDEELKAGGFPINFSHGHKLMDFFLKGKL